MSTACQIVENLAEIGGEQIHKAGKLLIALAAAHEQNDKLQKRDCPRQPQDHAGDRGEADDPEKAPETVGHNMFALIAGS